MAKTRGDVLPPAAKTSMIEKCAEEVARDIAPEALTGFDLTTLLTTIISIIQSVISKCPQQPSQMRGSFKKPNVRQRAAVLKEVKETCDCCGLQKLTKPMYDSIIARASSLPEADATALITEVSDERNLLI